MFSSWLSRVEGINMWRYKPKHEDNYPEGHREIEQSGFLVWLQSCCLNVKLGQIKCYFSCFCFHRIVFRNEPEVSWFTVRLTCSWGQTLWSILFAALPLQSERKKINTFHKSRFIVLCSHVWGTRWCLARKDSHKQKLIEKILISVVVRQGQQSHLCWTDPEK